MRIGTCGASNVILSKEINMVGGYLVKNPRQMFQRQARKRNINHKQRIHYPQQSQTTYPLPTRNLSQIKNAMEDGAFDVMPATDEEDDSTKKPLALKEQVNIPSADDDDKSTKKPFVLKAQADARSEAREAPKQNIDAVPAIVETDTNNPTKN